MKALPLDTTGKDGQMAAAAEEEGGGGVFSVFPLFMPRYGERTLFRESRNVHFRHLRAEAWEFGAVRKPAGIPL